MGICSVVYSIPAAPRPSPQNPRARGTRNAWSCAGWDAEIPAQRRAAPGGENRRPAANAASSSAGLWPGRLAGPAICGIADQGMAQMGEMDPDLMGAAGFQPAFDQGGEGPRRRARISPAPDSGCAPACRRRAAPPCACGRRGCGRSGLRSRRRPARGAAPHHGMIGALDGVIGELLGQAGHGPLGLGRHQQARRVLVQPMDDAGPRLAADADQARRRNGRSGH